MNNLSNQKKCHNSDDKKLIVEHALGIEYYEGIKATSPQALIECMDQVESVLLRNQPGTQATLIKQYLDNSLLKLCLSKNIPRIWMPTVSCPQITEDVIIDFFFGGASVSHVFRERKLHIYGPSVTPKLFEKLVEVGTPIKQRKHILLSTEVLQSCVPRTNSPLSDVPL